jgi:hypothetical protein
MFKTPLKPNSATHVGNLERPSGQRLNRVTHVTDYRLYGLDRVNKVASGEWFEADYDEAAIEVAKTLMDGHDCELWSGKRRVAVIKHDRKR